MTTVGIDLGTTNSCAALLRGGAPQVIPSVDGGRMTASMVAIDAHGGALVGEPARRQAVVNPTNTVFSVKRLLGRPFSSEGVQALAAKLPFRLSAGPDDAVRLEVGGRERSPEELAAMILAKVRSDAADFSGGDVRQAVVTVPAHFDDRQRKATRDAARIAGFEVLRVLNEPTAAALAYGFARRLHRYLAVYDLGGGTCDVTILEQQDGDFHVLATSGDAFLGGDDFDRVLMDWLNDAFRRRSGVQLPSDPTVLQRLRQAAEDAKRELTLSDRAQVRLPFIASDASGARHLELELERAGFEDLVAPLVERSLGVCEAALGDSGLDPDRLDAVLLVGGQTRTPLVQRMVSRFFGRPTLKEINPDEAVALGAALTAGVASGELADVTLRDVVSLSLGVETAGGRVSRIIPRNTAVPVSRTRVFGAAAERPMVRIHVVQGEQPAAVDNHSLGWLDVFPVLTGAPEIAVTFEVNAEGILDVTACDRESGLVQRLRLEHTGGLSEPEIDELMRIADDRRALDVASQRWSAARNRAWRLVRATEGHLEDPDMQMSDAQRWRLLVQLERIRRAMEGPPDVKYLEAEMEILGGLIRDPIPLPPWSSREP